MEFKHVSYVPRCSVYNLHCAFPRLYALAPDTATTVRSMWTGAWTAVLPQALSDQRLAEFMSLQVLLANLRPTDEIKDAWRWYHSRFSARAVYCLVRGQAPPEVASLVRRCWVIWKQRLPLKIRIFGWLLVRHRLMTRAMRHRLFPGAVVNCPLCDGEVEDCSHLFFMCPMVQGAWQTAGVACLVTSSDEDFWSSLIDSSFRRETVWRRVFATLWEILIHRNEVIFRGVAPSGDAIQHAAGSLLYSWNRGGSGPSHLYPCKD